ncbi:MAG TPA: BREX system P-loop protein BrxC [Polyangiaceae bacterium]|nr:BREX system P-loop protein BrxC [Polyangiaceae bacterium]
MKIRDIFHNNVTRDIPPVVYFHEQSAEKIEQEVREYIITGGYPEKDPRWKRVKEGIHEEFVRLLRNIRTELDKKGGPELPACWISGYYGSGKSSFAKLLGLSLDSRKLRDGTPVSEALLARDESPLSADLRKAWSELIAGKKPIAVAFDIGAVARDAEHVHATIVRQVQIRLNYCSTSSLVAGFELKLELDNHYEAFLEAASRVLKRPWSELKDTQLADTHFSHAMHALDPERYREPTTWLDSQAFAQSDQGMAVTEAVRAIENMLEKRAPGRTLFIVVDEVSQYVHDSEDRMLKLQSFVAELGARLKGNVWLLATGQQKLDDAAGLALAKMKDRFPQRLRVHLSTANIRDVVHRRLLKKASQHERTLRDLFQKHRPALALYGYGCEDITEEDFVEVYPMLPKQIDLLLRITTALRSRSTRAQGDAHAIRGLLQLLGELFRAQRLADGEVGELVTLDRIFEVLHTALDADAQVSLARVLDHCSKANDDVAARAAKAVALLERIQEETPTTAELVAQCLYARLGHGDDRGQVTEALERLRASALLSYSEKLGYKLQSYAGQEWERERSDYGPGPEQISGAVRGALELMMADVDRPRLNSRPFPWMAFYSDGRQANDVRIKNATQDAVVVVDFRWVIAGDRGVEEWVRKSNEELLRERFLWVAGGSGRTEDVARRLLRSRRMIERYAPKRETLADARKPLLLEEESTRDELEKQLRQAVEEAFLAGTLYFSGRQYPARDEGGTFATALHAFAEKRLKELYPQYIDISISPSELAQLLQPQLAGPSVKFFEKGLGILSLDAGRVQPTCDGLVPRRTLEMIKKAGGLTGGALLATLGKPPFGYAEDVVQACAAGLLRASKIRIELEGGTTVTSVRDPGVQNLFSKDRDFRRATFFPTLEEPITQKDRTRICTVLETYLTGVQLDRENDAIADTVFGKLGEQRERLRKLEARFVQVPGQRVFPEALERFGRALEACRASREVEPTVKAVKQHLDTLRDGFETLGRMESALDENSLVTLKITNNVLTEHAAQLEAVGALADVTEDVERLRTHLASERPWVDAPTLMGSIERITSQYRATRKSLLGSHEVEAEAARQEIKRRQGFELLNPDQAHRVLRPITEALWETSPEAVAPRLDQLRDGFPGRLARAKEEANDRLDQERNKREERPVVKVDLHLRGRELESPEQIEALLRELEERLLPLLKTKQRVRIVG